MDKLLEPFQVACELEKCAKKQEELGEKLWPHGKEKVETEVEYEKEFDIALECLASNDVPVTVRKKKAEAVLARNGVSLKAKMADMKWKILNKKIDIAKHNADIWRSYNKHLDIGVR
jgi:hypothetical protein